MVAPVAAEQTRPQVRRTGPNGCPVMHGFDPLGDEAVYAPARFAELSQREAPVFWVPEIEMFVATRHEDVRRILTDAASFEPFFPSFHDVPAELRDDLPTGFVYEGPGVLPTESPPAHTRLRRLAQKAFTPRAAQAKAAEIRAVCDALIDGFQDAGEADLVQAYTTRFPIRVLAVVMNLDPEIGSQLYAWANTVGPLIGQRELPPEQILEIARAQVDFRRWTLDLIEQRRREPRGEGDIVTALTKAGDDEGAPPLTDDEIFGVIVATVLGGADTSANASAQLLRRMLCEPALLEQAREDPDAIDRMLEEELRIDFIGRLTFRRVARDGVELGGVPLPRGAVVGGYIWAANRDAAIFEDPGRFDPARPNVAEHLSWSKGTHFCMGAPLARVQIRIAIETLIERLDGLRLVPGHELERRPSFFIPSIKRGLVVGWDV
jgi:cytochrome P450